jgi:methyltransferase (TIGR00027 family)
VSATTAKGEAASTATTASKTALLMAAYRGRASAAKGAICADPWAAALAGDEGAALATSWDKSYPHMELWTAVRTAFIDACVRRAIGAIGATGAMRQVVLLGAGLDTRAARLAQSGVRFFEVDRPDTQHDKLARVAALEGYPRDAATYVPCDFEKESFLARLTAAGFDVASPAMFVWEGVTPYLTEGAVRATLRTIAEGTDGRSALVFDHVRKKIVRGDVRDPMDLEPRAIVEGLGEPLRFGVDDPLPLLYEEGFRKVRVSTFDEACLDLTGTYERERKFRFQGLVVASRAARELPV